MSQWGLNRTASTTVSTPQHQSSTTSLLSLSSVSLASNALRRNSLYGFEDRIVLDIGTSLLRAGISGEQRPRIVLDISVPDGSQTTGLYDLHLDPKLDMARRETLTSLLLLVYNKYLLTDPKQRKVIVAEKALMPTQIKLMIADILFRVLNVPAVQFASSELLTLLCTGKSSGLVVDIGPLETSVVPIYDGRPLPQLVRMSPIGTQALTSRLDLLIRNHAKITLTSSSSSGANNNNVPAEPASEDPTELMAEFLSSQGTQYMQNLAARICFVANASTRQDVSVPLKRNPLGPYAQYDSSTATDISIHVEWMQSTGNILSSQSTKRTVKTAILTIPGWVRERAAEVWFEGTGTVAGEDDSLTTLIMDALVRVPLDSRAEVAAGIVLTGGGSMVTGVFARVENELRSIGGNGGFAVGFSAGRANSGRKGVLNRFDEVRRLVRDRSVVLRTVFKSNLLPWIGGSLAGSVKMISSEVVRDSYFEVGGEQSVPDWCKLVGDDTEGNDTAVAA
ncbi:hypothetical protein HDU78_006743 [Chytriomyces hyalinus]|nr:hypothetical protein HDU78_006743 [Chytriomyces hyalinus]